MTHTSTALRSGIRWSFGNGTTPHRVHVVHRSTAAIAGLALGGFGVIGLLIAGRLGMESGTVVLGLFTNGMLSLLSVVVAGLLIASAVRGGPASSTTMLVLGPLFVVSGVGNSLVVGTSLNMLAFQASDVIFSLLAGALLTVLGAYGRFTGGLPLDNPYALRRRAHEPVSTGPGQATSTQPAGTSAVAIALADAERAVAQHSATTEQIAGVRAAHLRRTHVDRVDAFTHSVRG